MCEIKFRGKRINRINNGEWVYGSLLFVPYTGMTYMFPDAARIVKLSEIIPVDPKTVGQYTGLKDDTGREAYTKDIYEDLDGKRFMVDFSDGMFTANYPHEDRLIPLIDCLNGSKFVGIYHENPELLKGEESE